MSKDKIVLFSSGDFGINTFLEFLSEGYNVVGVVTSNDKVLYSSKKLSDLCVEIGIPFYVVKTATIGKDESLMTFLDERDADLYCVISFKKLPNEIISKAKKCAFNIHASLLPLLRGAAPITNAIRLGFRETGLTAFLLTDKIDCGPILANEKVEIQENESYNSLFQRLSLVCALFAKRVVDEVLSKDDYKSNLIEQPSFDFRCFDRYKEILVAPKIAHDDYMFIPWRKGYDFTNAVNMLLSLPSFPAQIIVYDKETNEVVKKFLIKIHEISNIRRHSYEDIDLLTETDGKTYIRVNYEYGSFDITRLQIASKKEMDVASFLNGFRYFNNEKYVTMIDDLSINFENEE